MKRTHGSGEREMELARSLPEDCRSTVDIQEKLKQLICGEDKANAVISSSMVISRNR